MMDYLPEDSGSSRIAPGLALPGGCTAWQLSSEPDCEDREALLASGELRTSGSEQGFLGVTDGLEAMPGPW